MNDQLTKDETADVLAALGDAGCRKILDALLGADGAVAVSEMSEALDVPESTLYRKLDRLIATPLVSDRSTVSTDGHPRTRYDTQVTELTVDLEDGLTVDAVLEDDIDASIV